MWTRLLLALLVVFGVWYYFNQKKAAAPELESASGAAPTTSAECWALASRANAGLTSAALSASSTPVDPVEWSRAENEASSRISAAESACGGIEPARRALSMMRASLMELSAGARGEGGTMGVAARQEEIDAILNRGQGR